MKTREKYPHYKQIAVTMYLVDLEKMDKMVEDLKQRGWSGANRSQLIRIAVAQVDLDDVALRVLRSRG